MATLAYWSLEEVLLDSRAQKILHFCEVDRNSSVKDIEKKLDEMKDLLRRCVGMKAKKKLIPSKDLMEEYEKLRPVEKETETWNNFCSRMQKERHLHVDASLVYLGNSIDLLNVLLSVIRAERKTEKTASSAPPASSSRSAAQK